MTAPDSGRAGPDSAKPPFELEPEPIDGRLRAALERIDDLERLSGRLVNLYADLSTKIEPVIEFAKNLPAYMVSMDAIKTEIVDAATLNQTLARERDDALEDVKKFHRRISSLEAHLPKARAKREAPAEAAPYALNDEDIPF